jgi:hypothetical protein
MSNSVSDTMFAICQDQQFRNYLLTGFYLTEEQRALIEGDLDKGCDLPGACGKYRGIPVYLAKSRRLPKGWARRSIDGVLFTYVVVDANQPSL